MGLTSVQQDLVTQYIPFAQKLAHQRKKSLPRSIDIDDLISAAYLGLTKAALKYDGSRATFSTYAFIRISGSITDYLREIKHNVPIDELPIAAKKKTEPTEFFEEVRCRISPKAEQILKFYFVEEYSMREIGDHFGVAESRISQLISSYKRQIQRVWFGCAA